MVAKKGFQHGHKRSVNANISRQSATDVQRRESTNVVFGSANHCRLKAVVPRAQMNKVPSTNRVCSRVFITHLLPKCTLSQLASHIQNTCRVYTKPEKLQTKYDPTVHFMSDMYTI